MISPSVKKLLEQVKALSDSEREQLLDLLKVISGEEQRYQRSMELAARLAKNGVTLTVAPKRTPEQIADFKSWRPIEMPGGPLSDDLVRDRR